MMKTMYGSTSAWDIGLDGKVFPSVEAVREAQIEALVACGVEDDYDELVSDNLVGFEEIVVAGEGRTQLEKLAHANIVRQDRWPGFENADLLFRAVEFGGEAGEVLDAVKKYARAQRSIAGNSDKSMDDLRQALMEEIGDVMITLDMLATDLGIKIDDCVAMKFNKTSRKVGIDVFMNADWDIEFGDGSSAS